MTQNLNSSQLEQVSSPFAPKPWLELLPGDLDRADEAIVVTDWTGRIEWANRAFLRLTTYELNEVLGRKPGSLLQGKDTDQKIVEAMRDAIALAHGIVVTVRNYTKRGQPYDVAICINPVLDEEGVVQHFVSVAKEVTGVSPLQAQASTACILSQMAEVLLICQTAAES